MPHDGHGRRKPREASDESDLCVRSLHVRGVREESREADFVCSTDTIDSYGEVVVQNWIFDRFDKNPICLYGHDCDELPIGTAKNYRVNGGQLEATIVFSKVTELAEQVWQQVLEKTLRAVSVGFRPREVRWEKRDDKDVYILDQNELYEISVVALPANPDAVGKMLQRMAGAPVARGVVPYHPEVPVDDQSWDGAAAESSIRKWASSDGSGLKETIDWAKYKRGFAWFDTKNAESFAGYKLPHHRVEDGKLETSRAGVMAAGNACMGGRGGVDLPADELEGVKGHLAKHYRQFDMTPPWEGKSTESHTDKTSPAPAEKAVKAEENRDMDLEKKNAELEGKVRELEGKVRDHESKASAVDLEIKTLKGQTEHLVKERDAALERAASAESQVIEHEVGALVGKKISPAEKPVFVELRKANKTLFDAMIEQRADMPHTTQVIDAPKEQPAPTGEVAAPSDTKLLSDFMKS